MIDLHIHTTHSDGRLRIQEILERAHRENIKIISFCDHNVLRCIQRIISRTN